MAEKKAVTPPASLGEEQVKFAKQFVQMRFTDGMSISDACKALSTSTATFYRWKDEPAFSSYMNALEMDLVTEDERKAYSNVKAYIMKKVSVENPSDKHVEMFFKYFDYVITSENAKRSTQLGITTGVQDFKTLEERKATLLTRLKG